VLHQPFRVYAAFGANTVDQVREALGALDADPAELAGLTE
jgi:aryl-alcohol dehydrogenase-like predicted oxidoreductase